MTYAHLGRSGLLVSRIALGTMDFGYLLDESTSFAVLDAAVEGGVNHLDTADVYGGPQAADMTMGYGISEEVIGRWLQRSGRRDEIVLATKAYQPMGLGPNDRRLSAYHQRRACEASLRQRQASACRVFFRPCRPAGGPGSAGAFPSPPLPRMLEHRGVAAVAPRPALAPTCFRSRSD